MKDADYLVFTDHRPEPYRVALGEPVTVPVACRVTRIELDQATLPVLHFRMDPDGMVTAIWGKPE